MIVAPQSLYYAYNIRNPEPYNIPDLPIISERVVGSLSTVIAPSKKTVDAEGNVYILNGTINGVYTNRCFVYKIQQNGTFIEEELTPSDVPGYAGGACYNKIDNSIYCFGRRTTNTTSDPLRISRYNISSDTWEILGQIPSGNYNTFTQQYSENGKIIVINRSTTPYVIWEYDCIDNTFREIITNPSTRPQAGQVYTHNNEFFCLYYSSLSVYFQENSTDVFQIPASPLGNTSCLQGGFIAKNNYIYQHSFNDAGVLILDTISHEWIVKTLPTGVNIPVRNNANTIWHINGNLYTFGSAEDSNNIYEYVLNSDKLITKLFPGDTLIANNSKFKLDDGTLVGVDEVYTATKQINVILDPLGHGCHGARVEV